LKRLLDDAETSLSRSDCGWDDDDDDISIIQHTECNCVHNFMVIRGPGNDEELSKHFDSIIVID